MGGAYSTRGERRHAYKALIGKPEEKRPLETRGRKRRDNIKINSRVIVCDIVEWIYLDQGRIRYRSLSNTIMIRSFPRDLLTC
jgi:hypothetical protein